MKNTFLVILSIAVVSYFSFNIPKIILSIQNAAGVFFVQSITISDLKRAQVKKILLVPGHEPNYGGAEYAGLKERNINVDIAREIKNLLESKPKYKVVVSRDKEKWNTDLQAFFEKNWNTIIPWKNSYEQEMVRLFNTGQVKRVTDGVPHNDAPPDAAKRLYGINKWVNENDFDIVIHIHVNDSVGKTKYRGFAIYIPEGQYSNAEATRAVAQKIEDRLLRSFSKSNLPKEDTGLVEDQELVAIGRHNTVDAASLLIEYAYIYEPWLHDPALREKYIKEMALQTYLGLEDFF